MGFSLEYSTVSGSIESYNHDILMQNGRYLYNGGGCEISVNTVSGNLEIY